MIQWLELTILIEILIKITIKQKFILKLHSLTIKEFYNYLIYYFF